MVDKTINFLTTVTLNTSWWVIRSSYLQRTAEKILFQLYHKLYGFLFMEFVYSGTYICNVVDIFWSGAYVINMKCMYTSALWHCWLHWADIRYIYWHSFLICAHELIGYMSHICGIWWAYLLHFGVYFIVFFLLACAVMWDLHVDLLHFVTWPRKSCCISFWSSWSKEWYGAIQMLLASCNANAITNGVTWPEVMLHLISTVLI